MGNAKAGCSVTNVSSNVYVRGCKNSCYKSSAVAEMGDRTHNRHGSKRGRGLLCPFRGEPRPRLIQCGLDQCLLPYQVASSSIQPLNNKHGKKLVGGWGCPFSGGRWVPIERKVAWAEACLHTKSHLSQSSRLATTDIGRKLGCAALGEGELGPHLKQYRVDRDYLRTK